MRNDSSRGLQEGGKLTYKVEGLALLKKASCGGNMKKNDFLMQFLHHLCIDTCMFSLIY